MDSTLSININSMRYPESQERRNLIERLHFDVPSNAFVSLLGRTGAGKTTLLRILAGLEHHYVGEIRLNGAAVVKPSRDVQVVFQDYRLLPWKTVYENIEFATSKRDAEAEKAQIEKWISIVGLNSRRNALPKTLSGGETGRVAFARAFVDQPKVLLLDEPFRGLDLVSKFRVQDALIEALREQPATVVLVSHSVEDAVFLSDTIHVLRGAPATVDRTYCV